MLQQLSLDDDGGLLKTSITVTSFSSLELSTTDSAADSKAPGNSINRETEEYFSVVNTLKKMQEVGRLNVHVVKAEGWSRDQGCGMRDSGCGRGSAFERVG